MLGSERHSLKDNEDKKEYDKLFVIRSIFFLTGPMPVNLLCPFPSMKFLLKKLRGVANSHHKTKNAWDFMLHKVFLTIISLVNWCGLTACDQLFGLCI